ncbi:MAG TPA: SufE family protein [Pirellulaceae bacterium]|nr:SufE family protein [Pirellulaceae bacterium]
MSQSVEELLNTFDLFDDWEDRYKYILELGDEVPKLGDQHKVETNRVQGCQSSVWLIADVKPGDPAIIDFQADSDSQIVRGLVAILLSIYSHRTPTEILAFDIRGLFEKIGLSQHLSRSRSNGFFSMVNRMRSVAEAALSA